MRHESPRSAAVYARISHDPSRDRSGVQRQEADCLAEAARRGWRVAEVYVDDDRSAYSARRPRPEYQRLLADIQLGLRDGVMIWRLDRLHRQPRELEEFIVICDKHRTALATVTGDVDLSSTQGRLLARAWGAFAAHESEVKAERISRALLEQARSGGGQCGGRPFGFEDDRRTIKKSEAAVVREAARRVLAGDSVRSICVDFDRRKLRTANGHAWRETNLRKLLINPRIAGQSQYRGEIVGKGRWKAIIRPAVGARLRGFFQDKYRPRHGPPSDYLLRRFLRCAWCSGTLSGQRRAGKRIYMCVKAPARTGCGSLSIIADDLEDFVVQSLGERLASDELTKVPARSDRRDRVWLKAHSELERSERLLETLARDYARGALSKREWQAMRPSLVGRIADAKALVMRDRYELSVAEFVGHQERLASAWGTLSRERRRAVVEGLIDYIEIRPAVHGQLFFNAARVVICWRGDPPLVRGKTRVPSRPRCSIPACTRINHARGLCRMHYARIGRTGRAGKPQPAPRSRFKGRPCKVVDCDRAAAEDGRCQEHYDLWLQEDPTHARCSVEACDRRTRARGLCNKHYQQVTYAERIKPSTPLNAELLAHRHPERWARAASTSSVVVSEQVSGTGDNVRL